VWKWKPDVEFQYGGLLGEFNGMSSQSHVSHCRVLPLGELTVTIPEPQWHATLQGAVTWRNQCRDRVTLHIRHIENRFLPCFIFLFVFLCSLGFDERWLSYRLRYNCLNKILLSYVEMVRSDKIRFVQVVYQQCKAFAEHLWDPDTMEYSGKEIFSDY